MDQHTTGLPAEAAEKTMSPVLSRTSGPRRIVVALLILLATVGCDRAAKYIAQDTLMLSPPISLLGDVVRFEYAENTGAFLSLGSDLPDTVRFAVLGVAVGLVLVGIIVYIFRTRTLHITELWALSLIAGGGAGNLIDRLTTGYVVDFVSMGFSGLRTGIFNVADVAITGGVLLFVLARLRHSEPEAPPAEPPVVSAS